jgi:YD repeat-containing protein
MKTLILFNLCLLFSFCEGQIYWAKTEPLKGPVKNMKTIFFRDTRSIRFASDSIPVYNDIKVEVIYFDKSKRTVARGLQDSTGRVFEVSAFTYDGEGNLIRQEDTIEKSYDGHSKYVYEKGNLVEEIRYDGKGEVLSVVKLSFDSLNNTLTKIEEIEGIVDDKVITKYNDSDSPIETIILGSDIREQHIIYKYNKRNELIEESFWNADSSNFKLRRFVYDLHGNIIQIAEFDKKLNLLFLTSYHYDALDNQVLELKYYPALKITDVNRTEYKYDNCGNWISKRTFNSYFNGKEREDSKDLRIIEYN